MMPMSRKFSRELNIFYKEHREQCTNCSRKFQQNDTIHLGYLKTNKPAVLCDNCRHLLKETVVRYLWEENKFQSPHSDEKLWRYMDLAKFISLISSKSLFFSSAQLFDDPFECAKGSLARKEEYDKFYHDFFKKTILNLPEPFSVPSTEEQVEEDTNRLMTDFGLAGQRHRECTYINCWHCNEYESEAMWKIYSQNSLYAVAIQTTAEKLYLALDKDPYIDIGKVNYIDYNKQYTPFNDSFWFKRKAFEHEKEVRAVLCTLSSKGSGISIPIDINMLIEKIYVAPTAPQWFADVVKDVIQKYDIKKPVLYSQLDDKPFY